MLFCYQVDDARIPQRTCIKITTVISGSEEAMSGQLRQDSCQRRKFHTRRAMLTATRDDENSIGTDDIYREATLTQLRMWTNVEFYIYIGHVARMIRDRHPIIILTVRNCSVELS